MTVPEVVARQRALVVGTSWTRHPFRAGALYVQHGPGAADLTALVGWLMGGCAAPVPVRQGFVAVLVHLDGRVVAASSSRTELTALYTYDAGRLIVATHPRDLLVTLGRRPALSVAKLADLVALHDDPSSTVYDGVQRLPVGHLMRWRPEQPEPQVTRWYSPSVVPDVGIDPASAPALMRDVVRSAVAASLPVAGDVAATLSGGLDSSMVVATAARLLGPQRRMVHTCTHVPLPGVASAGMWEPDDGPYARQMVAESPGLTWTPLTNTARTSPFELCWQSFAETWLPVMNPANHVWISAAVEHAAQAGSPVLLTGATGNGPFSRGAAGPLRSLASEHRYGALGRHIANARRAGTGWRQAAWPVVAAAAPGVLTALQRRRGRTGGSGDADIVAALPVRPEQLSVEAQERMQRLGGAAAPSRDDWVDFVLKDSSLRARAPRAVWWSDPLSDPEVVALALRLPHEAWLAGGRTRGLAREAARGLVPDHIRLRSTRGGQSHDLGLWLAGRQRHLNELYEQVAASPAAQQFLDLPRLRAGVTAPDLAGLGAMRWESVFGRALGFGLFAAWYESQAVPPAPEQPPDRS